MSDTAFRCAVNHDAGNVTIEVLSGEAHQRGTLTPRVARALAFMLVEEADAAEAQMPAAPAIVEDQWR